MTDECHLREITSEIHSHRCRNCILAPRSTLVCLLINFVVMSTTTLTDEFGYVICTLVVQGFLRSIFQGPYRWLAVGWPLHARHPRCCCVPLTNEASALFCQKLSVSLRILALLFVCDIRCPSSDRSSGRGVVPSDWVIKEVPSAPTFLRTAEDLCGSVSGCRKKKTTYSTEY